MIIATSITYTLTLQQTEQGLELTFGTKEHYHSRIKNKAWIRKLVLGKWMCLLNGAGVRGTSLGSTVRMLNSIEVEDASHLPHIWAVDVVV